MIILLINNSLGIQVNEQDQVASLQFDSHDLQLGEKNYCLTHFAYIQIILRFVYHLRMENRHEAKEINDRIDKICDVSFFWAKDSQL